MTDPHTQTLLNRSRYYWRWWELTGKADYLASASAFLRDFERLGGSAPDGRARIEAALGPQRAVTPASSPTFGLKGRNINNSPTIFGYTYEEIGAVQGTPPIK